jgi:hypothetical protein
MAMVPLAVSLIPLLPGLIKAVMDVVDRVQQDPSLTPEQRKAVLDTLSIQLAEVNQRVQATQLPSQGPTVQ